MQLDNLIAPRSSKWEIQEVIEDVLSTIKKFD